MASRFGEEATIAYHDASIEGVRQDHADVIDEIEKRGLLFPVTVINGQPLYDGAVSYPAILRAVQSRLAERASTA
jgi:disulfide oxidoreductase YuzD